MASPYVTTRNQPISLLLSNSSLSASAGSVYQATPWICDYANKVTLNFSGSGKSTDTGLIKAFNSKLHTEYVNAHWFLTLENACKKLKNWHRHYNEDRPHSAIEYDAPIAPHNPDGVISQPLGREPENSDSPLSKLEVQCSKELRENGRLSLRWGFTPQTSG
ncbi:transposase [Brucella pseudogrignonensis]|uniref:integrase core domain-containing protein n=1 Tax=Brucella pseudogrignonensis TaxID=419475 RepID=UPI00286B5A9F|nr:transposase [Brucella pseudogrignonensis]